MAMADRGFESSGSRSTDRLLDERTKDERTNDERTQDERTAMSLPAEPPPGVAERIAEILGSAPVEFTPVEGGYTPAQRWRVELSDGRAVFAKRAVEAFTLRALRAERRVYTELRGDFMPRFLGWHEDDRRPLLLLEFLEEASTAPPWDATRVDAVLDALARLHVQSVNLPAFDRRHADLGAGWAEVDRDSEAFLSLQFVTRAWLDRHLHRLVAAEGAQHLTAREVGHFDLRSDNILFVGDRAVLVDWSAACHGPPDLDIGLWLPSLHFEGGPPPEDLLPGAPMAAAWVSGFFASRAGLPDLPHAPRVRKVQREQLRAALPWALRELGLPEADGPNAGELLVPH